ncbi:MAG: Lrp/AsnC family transcriptional regulator [Eubacteriales bacterium]|nr:Lrp/AsnC family transcriptional regulator [Eubacteriales bacterium]MDD4327196.1 Lrp/AsnC family transcriptional regulator [Eubacteriales bacterium]MDD4718075.1 Lrp/AsnC family transcriptional regulator [Eubacteriales bacterium]NCU25589.1 Lrp/AsnC family transcriptional regulator [Candidatus Nomurabacteria bacterium]
MTRVLGLLDRNAKLTAEDIATRIKLPVSEVEAIIHKAEQDGMILGYKAVINWDRIVENTVTAMIEVRITPQQSLGFDRIARRIYSFPQVKDCLLMSGGFDLLLIVEDRSLKDVANFVSEKVAQLDNVISTATHFILKRYKSNGVIFEDKGENDREAVVL